MFEAKAYIFIKYICTSLIQAIKVEIVHGKRITSIKSDGRKYPIDLTTGNKSPKETFEIEKISFSTLANKI